MIRRFRPLKRVEMEALERALSSRVAGWASDWLSNAVVPSVGVQALGPDSPAGERGTWLSIRGEAGHACLWLSESAELALARGLMAPGALGLVEALHPVLAAVARSAAEALLRACVSHAAVCEAMTEDRPPESTWFVRGLGNARICVTTEEWSVTLIMDTDCVEGVMGQRPAPATRPRMPALVSRAVALKGGKVKLQVRLRESELTVADMKRLQIKDVIMFDHPIGSPLAVHVRGGTELGFCYLGQSRQRRAAKLIRREDSRI